MATSTLPPTPEQLVSAAYVLRKQLAPLQADLELLEAKIVDLGDGKHVGLDAAEVITVAKGSPAKVGEATYPPIAGEQAAIAKDLAGKEAFGKLFKKLVTYVPVQSFADVAKALLKPSMCGNLLGLCEVAGKLSKGREAYIHSYAGLGKK